MPGTILASVIIAKGRVILQDPTAIRWPDSELLKHLNEGQRYICAQRPDASSILGNLTLIAGTKQSLPAGETRLLDVKRNMGADGATAGAPIRLTSQEILDAQVPDWHSRAQNAVTQHYVYDERSPTNYYVFPPAVANQKIEALRSKPPTDIATVNDVITLDDIYEPLLLDYMLYRAWQKDAEYAADPQRSAFHLNAVNAALGIKIKVDMAAGPMANAPANPNVAAGGGAR